MISVWPQIARRVPEIITELRRSWVAGTSPAMTIKRKPLPPTPERSISPESQGGEHGRSSSPEHRRGVRGRGRRGGLCPPHSLSAGPVRPPAPAHPGRERLLDLGCGPGKLTLTLAPHFREVLAVDPSAAMLRLAQHLDAGANPHIAWTEAFAEDVALPANLDLIVAGASIHWMDAPRLFPRLAAALAPQGQMAILGGDGPAAAPWIAAWNQTIVDWVGKLGASGTTPDTPPASPATSPGSTSPLPRCSPPRSPRPSTTSSRRSIPAPPGPGPRWGRWLRPSAPTCAPSSPLCHRRQGGVRDQLHALVGNTTERGSLKWMPVQASATRPRRCRLLTPLDRLRRGDQKRP
uniref:Methyltransferase domain-containing protein n=1 Tax=Phenylobacterium glaciei TaxID=2803784 RepID=A0A974P348_9CAUL|nr:methyltransferase domain-containing protein [Phenylobacterium glaciei]